MIIIKIERKKGNYKHIDYREYKKWSIGTFSETDDPELSPCFRFIYVLKIYKQIIP